jgi:hypothetical protein
LTTRDEWEIETHGAVGRFRGAYRVNVESVPRLPTFPAAWTIGDPRQCAYFVFWTGLDGSIYLGLRMDAIDGGHAVQISTWTGDTFPIKILRQPLPRTEPPRSCIGARGAGNLGAISTR